MLTLIAACALSGAGADAYAQRSAAPPPAAPPASAPTRGKGIDPEVARRLAARATQRAASPRLTARAIDTLPTFPVQRIGEDVYAVLGDTGRGSEGRPNAGFVVTGEGVVVIDALASPLQGERLVRTIGGVTKQPIRWLILTHHHPDHHFGAIALRRAGARVIAHPERATLAAENGEDALVSDWTGVIGLREMHGFEFANTPDIAVTGDTTLRLGGRTIVVSHPGPAHTPGDLIVSLPAERVLFAGDLLIEDGVTMVVDGSSGALLAALARMDSLDARVAVPGHGRVATDPRALIRETRCYLERTRAAMRSAMEEGTSMTRMLRKLPPADEGRPVSRPSRERRNAVRIYLEMEREAMSLGQGGDSARAQTPPGGTAQAACDR